MCHATCYILKRKLSSISTDSDLPFNLIVLEYERHHNDGISFSLFLVATALLGYWIL